MAETVAAVVVTYNRKELLKECIEGILNQTTPVDTLVIVDNDSTDGTPEFLRELSLIGAPAQVTDIPREVRHVIYSKYDPRREIVVSFVRMQHNTGGAGGFYEGMKRAYEKGYDWIWVMDDDVQPEQDCLARLLSRQSPQVRCMVPLRLSPSGGIVRWPFRFDLDRLESWRPEEGEETWNNPVEADGTCFEGGLFHRSVVEQVGLPERLLFIAWDDTEYGLRLREVTSILYVTDAKLVRLREERPSVRSLLRLGLNKKSVVLVPPWKLYFVGRNMFYLKEKHSRGLRQLFNLWRNAVVYLLSPVLYLDPDIYGRIRETASGVWDGARGNFNYPNADDEHR